MITHSTKEAGQQKEQCGFGDDREVGGGGGGGGEKNRKKGGGGGVGGRLEKIWKKRG